jgi:hypothetical protein
MPTILPTSLRLDPAVLRPGLLLSTLAMSLAACGGGGGGSTTTPTPTPTPTPAAALPRLFAPLVQADPASPYKYLKGCYFPTQKFGTVGQSGSDFLESLVVDVASTNTAVLYNAQNGNSYAHTNRSYKGSNPIAGAPPQLWTGVFKLSSDGAAVGFGAPCTPTTMLERPSTTCYWLAEDVDKRSVAIGAFTQIDNARPQTSSGASILLNPGWESGTAYYFYYEMSFGPACSAPDSKTIWRSGPILGS